LGAIAALQNHLAERFGRLGGDQLPKEEDARLGNIYSRTGGKAYGEGFLELLHIRDADMLH